MGPHLRFRRSSEIFLGLLLGLLLGPLTPSMTWAQSPIGVEEDPELIETSTTYRLQPHEISHFSLAQAFFLRAHHMAQAGRHSEHLLGQLFEQLRIPMTPETLEFFNHTVEDGMAVILANTANFELEGDAFDRFQFDALNAKADQLGAVFRELLDGLSARGVEISGVLDYCEQQIRPNISISTTDPVGDSYFGIAVSSFDQHLVGLEVETP